MRDARRFVLCGTCAGALLATAVRFAPLGGDAAVTSHFLFLAALPWSALVLALDVLGMVVSGRDSMSYALFYAMPVVAGAGWGWVFAALWNRLVRRTRSRSA